MAPAPCWSKPGGLLDVKTGDYRIDQGILIVDERIKEVGPLAVIQSHAPKDVAIIDLTQFTVLPGLIDAHTHLPAKQLLADWR